MVLHFVNLVWNAFLSGIVTVCHSMMLETGKPCSRRRRDVKLFVGKDDKRRVAAFRSTANHGGIIIVEETVDPSESSSSLTLVHERTRISQPNAAFKYLSLLAHTYPSDLNEASVVDQWVEMHDHFAKVFDIGVAPSRFGLSETFELGPHRAFVASEHIPRYLGHIDAELEKTDERWLGNLKTISMADIAWFTTLTWLQNGGVRGVDATFLREYPRILAYIDDVRAQVAAPDWLKDADSDKGCGEDEEEECCHEGVNGYENHVSEARGDGGSGDSDDDDDGDDGDDGDGEGDDGDGECDDGDGEGDDGDGEGDDGDGEGDNGDGEGDNGDGEGDNGDGEGDNGDREGDNGDGEGDTGDGRGDVDAKDDIDVTKRDEVNDLHTMQLLAGKKKLDSTNKDTVAA